jgi:hypothetical protein
MQTLRWWRTDIGRRLTVGLGAGRPVGGVSWPHLEVSRDLLWCGILWCPLELFSSWIIVISFDVWVHLDGFLNKPC